MLSLSRRSLIALMALTVAGGAGAQSWPDRTLTFVTNSGAGGQSDAVVRTLAEALKPRLNQAVVVENKPGANTTLAAQYGARANPDGYTFLFMGMGSHAPVFSKNNAIVLSQAMVPVGNVYASDWFFFVRKDMPVNSVSQLIEWSQKNDLKVGGATASVQLALAMFNDALAKSGRQPMKFRYIPYRNDPAVLMAMGSRDVHVAFASPSTFLPQVKADAVRVLLASGTKRSDLLPQVPTAIEQGIDFSLTWNVGVWAPKDTSAEIVARMSTLIQDITKTKAFKDRMAALGVEAAGSSADEFRQTYDKALRFWTDAARMTGFEPL